ncbi:12295_t:CDS:2, partial [Ambispora gerdemannii]
LTIGVSTNLAIFVNRVHCLEMNSDEYFDMEIKRRVSHMQTERRKSVSSLRKTNIKYRLESPRSTTKK